MEAVDSSFIEGLRASNKKVALAAYEPPAADGTARAVANNVKAMERAIGVGVGDGGTDFTLEDLVGNSLRLAGGHEREPFRRHHPD